MSALDRLHRDETSDSRAVRMNEMTIGQVAEVFNCHPETVKGYVRELWPDQMQKGVTTRLTETQITIILEKMKTANPNQYDLQSSVVGVETSNSRALRIAKLNAEIQRELEAELEELRAEKERLELRAAEDAPKIEHYEQCMSAKGAISMRNAAATLNIPGMGRNKIFAELRKKQVLDGNNIPYRKFQDAGYFRVITNSYADSNGDTHTVLTTLVFPSGLDYIRRVVTQEQVAE